MTDTSKTLKLGSESWRPRSGGEVELVMCSFEETPQPLLKRDTPQQCYGPADLSRSDPRRCPNKKEAQRQPSRAPPALVVSPSFGRPQERAPESFTPARFERAQRSQQKPEPCSKYFGQPDYLDVGRISNLGLLSSLVADDVGFSVKLYGRSKQETPVVAKIQKSPKAKGKRTVSKANSVSRHKEYESWCRVQCRQRLTPAFTKSVVVASTRASASSPLGLRQGQQLTSVKDCYSQARKGQASGGLCALSAVLQKHARSQSQMEAQVDESERSKVLRPTQGSALSIELSRASFMQGRSSSKQGRAPGLSFQFPPSRLGISCKKDVEETYAVVEAATGRNLPTRSQVVKQGGLPPGSPPRVASEVLKLKLLAQIRTSMVMHKLAPAPQRSTAAEKQPSELESPFAQIRLNLVEKEEGSPQPANFAARNGSQFLITESAADILRSLKEAATRNPRRTRASNVAPASVSFEKLLNSRQTRDFCHVREVIMQGIYGKSSDEKVQRLQAKAREEALSRIKSHRNTPTKLPQIGGSFK